MNSMISTAHRANRPLNGGAASRESPRQPPKPTIRPLYPPALRADPLHAALSADLHTTLDLEQMLSIFSRYTAVHVEHDGSHFRSHTGAIEVSIGRTGYNAWELIVATESERVGHLSITRDVAFSAEERMVLQRLGGCLHYPLRNALRYRRAVQAAHQDALTGVRNRAAFEMEMIRNLGRRRPAGEMNAILVVDVDHFKTINDQYGHARGDAVLRAVAARLRGCIRGGDGLFRYGGDEFVVFAHDADEVGIGRLAERIRSTVCDRSDLLHHHRITVSIGATTVRRDDDAFTLFQRADRALYEAKRAGRNRTEVV